MKKLRRGLFWFKRYMTTKRNAQTLTESHVRKKQLYMTFGEDRKSEYGQVVNDLGNNKFS